MTAKTLTYGQYVEGKTDEELIEEAKGLYNSIYVVDCFSSRDITLFDWIVGELEKRGYEVETESAFSIEKKEDA